ncbi:activator of 90 kDa heat shock protein ATPase homolog 1 [Bacillus rossius redtenbacheri]|uniref:activator of 90 kDa heat shock protein ATPase homolog 1 n=1 Tax=Bacillus rossius redtenbacheri TaxID=93214 RepID=UPI002FDCD415
MAKWGEGDPRWIVEERPDATNVNNWHWTEKNACAWSTEKLKELLADLRIESDLAKCKVMAVDKCDGEAVVNNRKGKLIFFYEWDIQLKWKGRIKSGDGTVIEGTAHIPNLSEENSISDIDVSVSVTGSSSTADILKDFMRSKGKEVIQGQLEKYIAALKEEFSQGMILPRKGEEGKESKPVVGKSDFNKQQGLVNSSKKDTKSGKVHTTTLSVRQMFQCTAQEFYNALTISEMVHAFTCGPVKMDLKEGGIFELFGGNIHGTFVELEPGKKIVQRWRLKSWPEGHFSTVTLTIDQKDDHTEVSLVQSGVPQSELDVTRTNWERYYWDAIKRKFGFGSFII